MMMKSNSRLVVTLRPFLKQLLMLVLITFVGATTILGLMALLGKSIQANPAQPIQVLNTPAQNPDILSDAYNLTEARLRYLPTLDDFDLQIWLQDEFPIVAYCTIQIHGEPYLLGDGIHYIAEQSHVDQRILFSLFYVQYNDVADTHKDCLFPPNFGDRLLEQGKNLINTLDGYYAHPYQDVLQKSGDFSPSAQYTSSPSLALRSTFQKYSAQHDTDFSKLQQTFYVFYAKHFGYLSTIPDYVQNAINTTETVEFKLPFIGEKAFTGGPHAGNTQGCVNVNPDETSGIDFSGGFEAPYGTSVISIAPGTIVMIQTDPNELGGKSVYIEHANGLVSGYWHLDSINSNLYIGQQLLYPGAYIGEVGKTGCPGCPDHIHLELRVGTTQDDIGTRVTWNGKLIDGWRIFSEYNLNWTRAVNYGGTVIKSVYGSVYAPTKSVRVYDDDCRTDVIALVDDDFSNNDDVNTEHTKFAYLAHTSWLLSSWLLSSNGGYCPAGSSEQTHILSSDGMCGSTPLPTFTPSASSTLKIQVL